MQLIKNEYLIEKQSVTNAQCLVLDETTFLLNISSIFEFIIAACLKDFSAR